MKNYIKALLCLIGTLFALSSCTLNNTDNSGESVDSNTAEVERNMLTNIFEEEPIDLPDGFNISGNTAVEHTGTETRIHLTKSILNEDSYNYSCEHYIYHIPDEGGERSLEKIELDDDVLGGSFSLFNGDDLIVFESSFDNTTFISTYNLVKCSLIDGKTERIDNVTDIFPSAALQITSVAADADGYIYMTDGNSLCVIAPDLTKAFDYIFRDYVNSLSVSAEGKVYATGTKAVYPIDRDSCGLGNPIAMPEDVSVEDCYFGSGYDIYYNNSEGLYGYNFGDEEGECVISWQNSNMSGIVYKNIQVLSPEEVLAMRYDERTNKYISVMLKKTDDIDLADYVTIEVAYLTEPLNYSRIVLEYNSISSKKIRVVSKDYSVYTTDIDREGAKRQLLLDITTGKYMPDIVIDTPDDSRPTDIHALTTLLKQGYYCDLYQFIDKDADIDRDDIVGAVKNSYEIDGKLSAAVPFFQIDTLIAPYSVFGDRTSWTMDEMLDFEMMLDGQKLINNKNHVFRSWRAAYSFIDVENGTCDFENETFIKYLNFITSNDISLPKSTNSYEHYQTGNVMLYNKKYGGPRDYMSGQIVFYPDDYTIIGYPAAANGLRRHNLIIDFAYMITKDSDNPEEAWDFIKYAIFYMDNNNRGSHFRMLKSLNDIEFENLMDYHVFYTADGLYSDWTGTVNPSDLDEENSIKRGGLHTYYNERDIERVKQLIEEAGYPVVYTIPEEIGSIINEEMSEYLGGVQSAEDAAKVIQSRVSIWLSERK